jgi:hypothetical protein
MKKRNLMTKKEKIRNNPWMVLKTAQRHYSNFSLSILIEPIEGTESFYLKNFAIIIKNSNRIKTYNLKETNNFYKDSMPFKQLNVLFRGEEPRPFDSYEKFLDEITDD